MPKPVQPPVNTTPTPFTLPESGTPTNTILGTQGVNDKLNGTNGNDLIDGRGGVSSTLGFDTLAGGKGDDTYLVHSPYDVINEKAGSGIDTAIFDNITPGYSIYALGNNVENGKLVGDGFQQLVGNDLNNLLIGNDTSSELYGLGGNDILIGGHGTTKMTGGAGNDIFRPTASDSITEVIDFTHSQDLVDISHLLDAVGYTGTNPFADGAATAVYDSVADHMTITVGDATVVIDHYTAINTTDFIV